MQTYEAEVIEGITDGELKSRYDAACKRVLAIKKFSARILKAVTEEYKDIDIDEIIHLMGNAEIGEAPVDADVPVIHMDNTEDITLTEGKRLFDIKFTSAVPDGDREIYLIINMESQNKFRPGYPLLRRGMYHCSRLISSQYGTVFTGSDYGKLRKVYSIWICMDPDKAYRNTITKYEMTPTLIYGEPKITETQKAKEKSEYDMMALILVCLGGEDSCNSENEIIRMLSVIFSEEMSFAEKEKILENDYNIAMTKDEKREVEYMCNLSEGVYERAEAKYKKKYLAEGRAEGRARGIKEGEARGIKEGEARGIKKGEANRDKFYINAMLSDNRSPEEIASILHITVEEVEHIIRGCDHV